MSFAAGQARLMMLIAEQYDIDLQMQFMAQHKEYLMKAVNGFVDIKGDYEPGSQQSNLMESRIYQLNEAEKLLDMRIESLRKRADAIDKERDSLSKEIADKGTKIFGNIWSSGG